MVKLTQKVNDLSLDQGKQEKGGNKASKKAVDKTPSKAKTPVAIKEGKKKNSDTEAQAPLDLPPFPKKTKTKTAQK